MDPSLNPCVFWLEDILSTWVSDCLGSHQHVSKSAQEAPANSTRVSMINVCYVTTTTGDEGYMKDDLPGCYSHSEGNLLLTEFKLQVSGLSNLFKTTPAILYHPALPLHSLPPVRFLKSVLYLVCKWENTCMLPLSHTHTHKHTLKLKHTHTHTHTQIITDGGVVNYFSLLCGARCSDEGPW